MNTTLDAVYIAATAIATVYVVIAVGVAARGRSDVIQTMAGDAFAYAMATALAAVIVGRLLRADEVAVGTLILAAIPFGIAATAFHALARREGSSRGNRRDIGVRRPHDRHCASVRARRRRLVVDVAASLLVSAGWLA